MKQFYFFCVATALLVNTIVANAQATSGQYGDNLYWSFNSSTGELTFTGSGDMYNYPMSPPWNSYLTNITSVSLPDGITSIDRNAFENCIGLTSITIPDSVTSIGLYAFKGSGLMSITIPNSIASISYAAFSGCTNLKSVIIPELVISIGESAFARSGLTSVTIPNSVTEIGWGAFFDCSDLESITVAGNNSNYSSIDGILFNKQQSTLIQCPGGKTGTVIIPHSVTEFEMCAFFGCDNLTSVINQSLTPQEINADTFSSDVYTNATLYVPAASLAFYKEAEGWERFNIKPLETSDITVPKKDNTATQIIGYYSLSGQKLPQESQKGMYIILYSNGKTEKVLR